jgi:phage terminase small subunit
MRTAKEQGYQLLRHPDVAAAIAEAQAERAKRVQITAEMVIAELAKIAFSNMADFYRVGPDGDPILDFSRLTRDQAAALLDVSVDDYVDARSGEAREVRRVKFRLADKRSALVDLGRHLGLFRDKVTITAPEDEEERAAEARRMLEEGIARLAAAASESED